MAIPIFVPPAAAAAADPFAPRAGTSHGKNSASRHTILARWEPAPELVVEVAASSASLDAQEKVASYRRAGLKEYVVWRTEHGEIDWWILEEDE